MYLVVEELRTSIDQDFTPKRVTNAVAFRPNLYIAGSPSGSLKITVLDGSTEIASVTQTIADIRANLGNPNYVHGVIRFTLSEIIRLSRDTYTLRLEGTGGYSYSNSDYVGWVQNHENLINEPDTTPTSDLLNPYGFELWSYKGDYMAKRILDFDDTFTSATQPDVGILADISIESTGSVYFGDSDTDGTWRITRSGTDLNIERRESGSYVLKETVAAS